MKLDTLSRTPLAVYTHEHLSNVLFINGRVKLDGLEGIILKVLESVKIFD